MKRYSSVLVCFLVAGCTTTPQADFCDFVFRSRNACAESTAANQLVVVNQPVVPVLAVPQAVAAPVIAAEPANVRVRTRDCGSCNLFSRQRSTTP